MARVTGLVFLSLASDLYFTLSIAIRRTAGDIEDPLDQGHCQWDVGSDKEAYLNASTYALYSVIMG